MNKTVLVTGATGFIGSHLVARLLEEGRRVVLLKRSFSDTWRIDHLLEDCIVYDIDKNHSLSTIFYDTMPQCIFHLATHYEKNYFPTDLKEMVYSNITFPTLLLEQAVIHNCKTFVNTGTFFQKTKENLYALTKINFETIAKEVCSKYGIKFSNIIVDTPYGEKDNENKIIPLIIKSALQKKDFSINNPNTILHVCYVKNIVEILMSAFLETKVIYEIRYSNLIKDLKDYINTYIEDTSFDIDARLPGMKNTIEYYKEKYGNN